MRRQKDFDPGRNQEGLEPAREPGREPGRPTPPPSSGISAKWVAAGVLILLLVIFAIANSERVEVNFLVTTTEARIVTVIVVSGLIGFLAGWLVGRPGRAERKAMSRGMEKD